MMNAVLLHDHGGPEVLRYQQIPTPTAGPGQVLVAVQAVALNHLDLWVRRGGPAFHLQYPHCLGSDIVGTVAALGAGVAGGGAAPVIGSKVVVSPGLSCGVCAPCLSGHDNLCRHYRIMGENAQGGYCEYIAVPRVNIAPYPARLSFTDAAAGILPFLTAWQMVVEKAQTTVNDTVLVHGAGSGIGVAAIQICKLLGARVIATAGSDEKLQRAISLGADEGINYQTSDFVSACRSLTNKRGVDVVIEHIGGEVFEKSIKAVRNGGRIVTCGATAGFAPAIDLRHIFFRQIEILGSTMGSKAALLTVLDLIEQGRLSPVVDRVFDLRDAAAAHQHLESRTAFGKVVLRVGAAT